LTLADWAALVKARTGIERRAYWRSGMLASVLANVHRDGDAHPEPFQPADFMPGEERERSSPEEMMDTMKTVAKAKDVS
jgi:hypothetical protein